MSVSQRCHFDLTLPIGHIKHSITISRPDGIDAHAALLGVASTAPAQRQVHDFSSRSHGENRQYQRTVLRDLTSCSR